MANIDWTDALAWIENTKLALPAAETDINSNLESQIAVQIFARLPASSFTPTAWTSPASTPAIIRTTIAMYYVAWLYDKYYSDDGESNDYAKLLRQYADLNIAGLVAGTVTIVDPGVVADAGSPSFFPSDESSRNEPTEDNPSDGPPAFTMGTMF